MRQFLSKKRYAFIFFFLIAYLIGLGGLYGIKTMKEAQYEKELQQKNESVQANKQNHNQQAQNAKDNNQAGQGAKDGQSKQQAQTSGQGSNALPQIEQKTVYEGNGITIRQLNLARGYLDSLEINLEIKNDTDKRYFVYADNMILNNVSVDGFGIYDKSVEPKTTAIIKFETMPASIKELGYADVLSVQSDLTFSEEYYSYRDETNSFVAKNAVNLVLPGGEELGAPPIFPKGDVIFDEHAIRVTLVKKDGKLYDDANWFQLFVENNTGKNIAIGLSSFDFENRSLNEGDLEDVKINNIIRIKKDSYFYGKIAAFTFLDLQEELEKGNPVKMILVPVSEDDDAFIGQEVYDIILK